MASSFPGAVDSFSFTPGVGKGLPYDDYQKVHDGLVAVETFLLPAAAWTSFTPTWTGLTVGNGTYLSNKYALIGSHLVVVEVIFQLGTTSSFTGGLFMSLPVNCTNAGASLGLGSAKYYDSSATSLYPGWAVATAAGTAQLLTNASPMGSVISTVPFTWATSDQICVTLTYQGV
jgi:hypothetical protein